MHGASVVTYSASRHMENDLSYHCYGLAAGLKEMLHKLSYPTLR